MDSRHTRVFLTASLFAVCGIALQMGQGGEARVEKAFEAISVARRDQESQKKLIRSSFDLDNEEVSAFMLRAMNRLPHVRGERRADEVMACVLDVAPVEGLEWLIDHYTSLSAVGRANMVQSLRLLEQAEAYDVVLCFLDDKSEVVSVRAENLAPGPYEHLRVCDYACNTLHHMLSSNAKSRAELPGRVSSDMKREVRDGILKTWKRWQEANARTLWEGKEKLTDQAPGLREKIAVFRGKAGR